MKKILEINTQMPIYPEELIPLQPFIDYCKENGLEMDEKVLEELHRQGLIFPAIKVYLGSESLIKYGHAKWLDQYEKKGLIEYPAQREFVLWKLKSNLNKNKKTDKPYIFFYDKGQMLAIKIALPYLNRIKYLESSPDWKLHKQQTIENIQKKISDLYRFLAVYYKIENFCYSLEKRKEDTYQKLKNELGKEPTKPEWETEFDFHVLTEAKKVVNKIAEKNNITKEFLHEWRSFLAKNSLINESNKHWRIKSKYIMALDDECVSSLEDATYMINVLNIFLYFLTGKEETVKQVLLNSPVNKICPVCFSSFKPRNRRQITCGKPKCIKENRNKSKRENRKELE